MDVQNVGISGESSSKDGSLWCSFFRSCKENTSDEEHLRSINIHKRIIPKGQIFNHFRILETLLQDI